MRTLKINKFALGTSALVGAMLLAVMGPAAAVPTFNINPGSVGSGASTFTASDIQGPSNGIIQQTGATTQVEKGFASMNTFINNGVTVSPFGTLAGFNWGLYLTFEATVQGISGFGPGNVGTIGAGDFTFTMYGDVGFDNTYNPGSVCSTNTSVICPAGNGVGPNPAAVGGNTANDVVIAVGTSVGIGNAGFQSTGGPIFGVTSALILCSGTAGQGYLGAELVTDSRAAACSTFNGAQFFTSPSPFYNVQFVTATTASTSNLVVGEGASAGYASLNGITATINFANNSVPEPMTLSLFGAGLAGAAAFGGRRRKKA
jgi:hypothetical protein